MSDDYIEIKKAEKALMDFIKLSFPKSIPPEKIDKIPENNQHSEDSLKWFFEKGLSSSDKKFIMTEKTMRIYAFIFAYGRYCHFQQCSDSQADSKLFQLYDRGEYLPEDVLSNQIFIQGYREFYKEIKQMMKSRRKIFHD